MQVQPADAGHSGGDFCPAVAAHRYRLLDRPPKTSKAVMAA